MKVSFLTKLPVISWFTKKEHPMYPEEYALVSYNDIAMRNGIEDYPNKIIIRYKYDYRTDTLKVFRVYGYSDSLVYSFRNVLKIPVIDKTLKDVKMPVFAEVNLDEVSYKKG